VTKAERLLLAESCLSNPAESSQKWSASSKYGAIQLWRVQGALLPWCLCGPWQFS